MTEYFVPALAVRVSGLSERSAGDGRNRSSVYHARCTQDVQIGRIKRRKGAFLCRDWQPWEVSEYPEGAVTCPRCLAILSRREGK